VLNEKNSTSSLKIFHSKVANFPSELTQFYAQSHVDVQGWEVRGGYMAAVDLRSLSLIGAMRRVGQGAGRHLVPYSRRFTLTETHRRHAARGPGLGPVHGPVQP
jgi:hypothetical protein